MATSPVPTTPVVTTWMFTSIPPTTPIPLVIDCDPIDLFIGIKCLVSQYPRYQRDPTRDLFITATPIVFSISIIGEMHNLCFSVDPIDIVITLPNAKIVTGVAVIADPIEVLVNLLSSYFIVRLPRSNFVKWSKIGYLDFTIDQSNLAGERPMDWKGWVYAIRKLGDRIVVYGENGVSILKPSDVNVGMTTIYRVGLKSKGAVAGDDSVNFFIDSAGKLLKLADKLTILDYSEYLSQMDNVVLSYDKVKELLYICDGIYGFVYGARTGSFGQGPINVTGIDSQSGNLFVSASNKIDIPKFELCTDIYDFGTRKKKTIDRLEIGSDLTENLYASVDYRVGYKDNFKQIGWFLVNPDGKTYPKCYGVEFRFRLKSFIYEYFELDYLKVRGHIHSYSPLDTSDTSVSRLTDLLSKG